MFRLDIPLSVRDGRARWVVLWIPKDLITEEEWKRFYEVVLPIFKVGLVQHNAEEKAESEGAFVER